MKTLKSFIVAIIFLMSSSISLCNVCKISNSTVEDYLDMAALYEENNEYQTALEYIDTIEGYDKYNPDILYKKACLLKELNRISEAENELGKLILLNPDYACSELAQTLPTYKDQGACSIQKH